MSEKSWDFFSPISFDTKFSLFTLISTYLVFVLGFVAMRGGAKLRLRVFGCWFLVLGFRASPDLERLAI